MNKQNNIRSATAYITQTQIEHATNWIAQFKQANRYALTQMLFACGFSRIKHNEKVTYILEK